MQIQRILVPTDFSENAQHAMEYAITLAKRCSATIHLLHAPVLPAYLLMDLSYSPGPEAVTRIMNEAREALEGQAQVVQAAGIEHFTAIRDGTVHETIRDYAVDQQIDVVVLGTHGRSGMSKLIYGSVTERVLKTAHTPIIVVPLAASTALSSILIAYDFSGPAKRAAEAGWALKKAFGGTVHLVHTYLDVWGEYTDRGQIVGDAAERRRAALQQGLDDMLKRDAEGLFGADAEGVETRLVTGDPADGILQSARETSADLICAGTTGKSGIQRFLLGSVARRLLRSSHVPLLLTHEDG